jgi:DNA-binding transcriptional MerR regulator
MSVAQPPLLTVAKLSRQAGLTGRTLRYYEELGLLAPLRSPGGHRLFTPDALETLSRIRSMQALGFSLATIRKVLRYRAYVDEKGRRHLALADLRSLAREARADLERVRARIRHLQCELAQARRSAAQLAHDCAYIEARLRERDKHAKNV